LRRDESLHRDATAGPVEGAAAKDDEADVREEEMGSKEEAGAADEEVNDSGMGRREPSDMT
jgi:hypothetical protein